MTHRLAVLGESLTMTIRILTNLVLLSTLVFLGACTSSGLIPKDMSLSLVNVVVTQSGDVEEGPRFSHELREEISREFSRAQPVTKKARLFVEVRELSYKGMETNELKHDKNKMITYTRLVDAVTGDRMGEFPMTVVSIDAGADIATIAGREFVNSDLIQQMATATLEKIYGKIRAKEMAENLPRHFRRPYLIEVENPIQLTSLNNSRRSNLAGAPIAPRKQIAEAEIKPEPEKKLLPINAADPLVIEAPVLPAE